MPNIKSAKKRVKITARKSILNNDVKSSMKTAIKKFEKAVKEESKEIDSLLTDAYKKIDNACKKGIIKDNTRDRYKSRLTKLIKK